MESKFIVLEGVDFSGKSTLGLSLTRHLNSIGVKTVLTAEPYLECTTGQVIKNFLYTPSELDSSKFIHKFLAYTFILNRLQHIEEIIKPALAEGLNVISDRYIYSNLIYNTEDGVTTTEEIYELHKFFFLPPDDVFFLDLSEDIIVHRILSRQNLSKFDKQHEKISERIKKYRDIFCSDNISFLDSYGTDVKKIDASRPKANMLKNALEYLEDKYGF